VINVDTNGCLIILAEYTKNNVVKCVVLGPGRNSYRESQVEWQRPTTHLGELSAYHDRARGLLFVNSPLTGLSVLNIERRLE
jgi:hypothetical protein